MRRVSIPSPQPTAGIDAESRGSTALSPSALRATHGTFDGVTRPFLPGEAAAASRVSRHDRACLLL